MQEIEYNLLDEPWIRVQNEDCSIAEVSLTDALLQAHLYKGLAGETATQDAAILRLLLAVLHTVYSRVDERGQGAPLASVDDALIRWGQLWAARQFDEKPIRDYLAQWHERFWLFHPERPFWQVPEAAAGTTYSAAKLNGELMESNNKKRLFVASERKALAYSDAARWLIYLNAYDDSSVKKSRTYRETKGNTEGGSPGSGWLGKIGLIQAQGNNLFETLLLNMALLKDGRDIWERNCPCWELNESRKGERIEITVPNNPAQLLTLQSRRIMLSREDGRVSGFSSISGDFFSVEDAFSEQMTVWRRTTDHNKPAVYVPKRHDPARFIWQELPSMFDITKDEPNIVSARMPGIACWIALLQQAEILDKRAMIRFEMIGVVYDSKGCSVTDSMSDTITFHAGLLNSLGMSWRRIIADEVERCEELAKAVSKFVADLANATGKSDSKYIVNADAEVHFFYKIDGPFREWLRSIDTDWDEDDSYRSRLEWRRTIQGIADAIVKEMYERAGESSMIGRMITKEDKKEKKTIFYSAPTAYSLFKRRVHEIYES